MAWTVINVNKDTGYAEYVVENESDLEKIPDKEYLFGCVAYCLENKKLYVMNNNREWEEQ